VTPPPRAPFAERDFVVLRANVAPEGWGDALLTLAAGLLILLMVAVLAAAAAAIAYAVTRDVATARVAAAAAFAVVVLASLLTQVHSLRVDARGLRFGRRRGRPRAIPWEDVLAVEPAPSREVVVRGWLWPPVTPREATRSLSSQGHYRIEYRGGTCYFPPIDVVAFRAAIRRWRPDLLPPELGS
jgi:hypothetical protein